MRSRLLRIGLLAYPREVRARDGDHLLELASDLAEHHGATREALGLLRGGLTARRRGGRTRRTVVAVAAAAVLTLTALTWTATAQAGSVEEDLFSCSGQCPAVETEVASRVADGWTCTERREPGTVSWRCTRG